MTTTADTPADTTMMRIVHDALRRDLARSSKTLAESARHDQRRAVGAHLGWMMGFLHAHHASEDDGLYPLVRSRADRVTGAVEVLDRMAADHDVIARATTDLERAAAQLALDPSDAATRQILAELDALSAVLLPHLRAEEDDAMPIVSKLLSAPEWQAIEQRHNLDPKPMSDLGFEGHWLIDGADEADRATVLRLVPAVSRFVLLHGFARRYRRHADACWGDHSKPARHVQAANAVAVTVDASIDDVWEVVRDVTRVGEWSHECVGASWLGGASYASPGARFRGRNRAGRLRWGRVCEIVAAEPYELVWRTVPTRTYPDSSEWRIRLEPVDGGTRIAQQFRLLHAPKVLSVLYALLIPAHRDRTAGLTQDLQRLGEVARRTGAAESRLEPRAVE
jgi:hypothetical protein